MPPNPPNPDPPRLRLPPLNDVLNRPPQPNDAPSITDVRDAIRYENEAFIARGVYHHHCQCAAYQRLDDVYSG
jgi:hypothetical protein